MQIDLMRDQSKVFPHIEGELSVVSLRVWFCKYSTLRPISKLANLKELVVASFPDDNFQMLRQLSHLKYLSILHLPNITSLEGLNYLPHLEVLSLATSPSWDSAGKKTIVESLRPLSALKKLSHLELLGVVPAADDLKPLEKCIRLQSARFSKYPKHMVEGFFSHSHIENIMNPPSSFH